MQVEIVNPWKIMLMSWMFQVSLIIGAHVSITLLVYGSPVQREVALVKSVAEQRENPDTDRLHHQPRVGVIPRNRHGNNPPQYDVKGAKRFKRQSSNPCISNVFAKRHHCFDTPISVKVCLKSTTKGCFNNKRGYGKCNKHYSTYHSMRCNKTIAFVTDCSCA